MVTPRSLRRARSKGRHPTPKQHHPWQRAQPLAAGLILLGGSLAPFPAAYADAPTAPPIVSGTVLDPDGSLAEATLSLYLVNDVPPPAADSDPSQSQDVLLATVVSDEGGAFSIPLSTSDQAVDQAATGNGGFANFKLVADTMSGEGVYYFSRSPYSLLSGDSTDFGPTLDSQWRDRETGDLLQPTSISTQALSATELALRNRSDLNASPRSGPPTGVPCNYASTDYKTAPVIIGEIHTWKNMSATVTYGRKADTTFGVAASYSGGGIGITGSAYVGNSHSSAVSRTFGAKYGKQLTSSFDFTRTNFSGCYQTSAIAPSRWVGADLSDGTDVSRFDGVCRTRAGFVPSLVSPNTTVSTSNESNYQYSVGATVWGVGLSAHSGYSQYVEMSWHNGNAINYICGNGHYWSSAPIVYAGG